MVLKFSYFISNIIKSVEIGYDLKERDLISKEEKIIKYVFNYRDRKSSTYIGAEKDLI